jgi:hypothetical protein
MTGKTDFIVNGSFERQAGGDAAAWIDVRPQFDPVGDGHTFQFRATLPPDGPPDSWSVTRGFFGLETEVAHAARAAWDGKVWGLAHDGTIAQQVTGLTAGSSTISRSSPTIRSGRFRLGCRCSGTDRRSPTSRTLPQTRAT